MKRVITYTGADAEDFASWEIRQKKLPPDYAYFPKTPLRKGFAFVFYHLVATPAVFLMQKALYAERIVGRKKLRPYRKEGYYLYGNHTRAVGDAFAPSLVAFPKKAYILANPDCVSIPGLRRLVEDLGAVPLPTSAPGMRNLYAALRTHARRGHVIAVYPEAHIWPYYTGIRPFPSVSFRYPAEEGKPVFTFTTVYHKRFLLPLPRTVVYIDGPFFGKEGSSPKENQELLCRTCRDAMVRRASLSTYRHVEYRKAPEAEKKEPEGKKIPPA